MMSGFSPLIKTPRVRSVTASGASFLTMGIQPDMISVLIESDRITDGEGAIAVLLSLFDRPLEKSGLQGSW